MYRHLRLALIGLALACSSGQAQTENSDPVIEQARKAAAVFVGSLPKYLVKRTTTRYASGGSGCSAVRNSLTACQGPADAWRTVDVVTADIVTDQGNEVDMNIRVNGTPATEKEVDSGGSWAEGDFNGALQAILSTASEASFTKKREVTIAKRRAWRYEYSIAQPNSSWHLSYLSGGSMLTQEPAFGGTVWIDEETLRVLRFEMTARNLPDSFPMTKVEWALDYDFVKVGDGRYLLPKHSEANYCQRNTSRCTRNVTDFQNYKEYVADTSISFEDGK